LVIDFFLNSNYPSLSRDDVLDQQLKLTDAKGKLKQLQGIIAKLKGVSSRSELTQRQQSELEQREAAAALQVLGDIEKQKQQQRLEQLKENKLKLLELLRQKEKESAELAKLCLSYSEAKRPERAVTVAGEEDNRSDSGDG